jgi:hypothetical protein
MAPANAEGHRGIPVKGSVLAVLPAVADASFVTFAWARPRGGFFVARAGAVTPGDVTVGGVNGAVGDGAVTGAGDDPDASTGAGASVAAGAGVSVAACDPPMLPFEPLVRPVSLVGVDVLGVGSVVVGVVGV